VLLYDVYLYVLMCDAYLIVLLYDVYLYVLMCDA